MLNAYFLNFGWLFMGGFLLFLYGVVRLFQSFETSVHCPDDKLSWLQTFRVYGIILAASVVFPVVAIALS